MSGHESHLSLSTWKFTRSNKVCCREEAGEAIEIQQNGLEIYYSREWAIYHHSSSPLAFVSLSLCLSFPSGGFTRWQMIKKGRCNSGVNRLSFELNKQKLSQPDAASYSKSWDGIQVLSSPFNAIFEIGRGQKQLEIIIYCRVLKSCIDEHCLMLWMHVYHTREHWWYNTEVRTAAPTVCVALHCLL